MPGMEEGVISRVNGRPGNMEGSPVGRNGKLEGSPGKSVSRLVSIAVVHLYGAVQSVAGFCQSAPFAANSNGVNSSLSRTSTVTRAPATGSRTSKLHAGAALSNLSQNIVLYSWATQAGAKARVKGESRVYQYVIEPLK